MRSSDRTDSTDDLVDVTPDDGTNTYEAVGITCRGTAGVVKVETWAGNERFVYVTPGSLNPVRVRKVLTDGGNTATDVQLYV